MPVIPATQAVEVGGGSQSGASLGKNSKPYLKTNKDKRDWGCCSSDRVLA
jgi:hypothetical protein